MKESDTPQSALPNPQSGDTIRASWSFSADRIAQDTSIYPPESRDTLLALFRWCIDDRHPMRRKDAAARIGCSENLLYQLLTGKYRIQEWLIDRDEKGKEISRKKHPRAGEPIPPNPELIKAIQDFLALEQKRYESGQTDFVITPTAKKIILACDLARESQTPVILWGPSHIGKTWTFRYYRQHNNHGRTVLAELEAASGLGGMVRKLAEASGISDKSNTASLIERIKRAWTPNTLVQIDEVHLLKHTYRLNSFFACIEVLRRLYDHCHCGMVLSWTNIDNLRDASQGELIQLWRRGVHKIALPVMPTKADIGSICHHFGLPGEPVREEGRAIPNCAFPSRDLTISIPTRKEPIIETPYEVLRLLAKRDGLLAITERLRYARKLANKAGSPISWTSFIDAHLRIEKQSIQEQEWS
jgi:hypothetical protein